MLITCRLDTQNEKEIASFKSCNLTMISALYPVIALDPIVPCIVREIMDRDPSSTFGHDCGTKCTSDAMSAAGEYTVGTIHALLPGILHVVEPGRNALLSKKAWREISTLPLTYVAICNPMFQGEGASERCTEQIFTNIRSGFDWKFVSHPRNIALSLEST